MCAQFLMAVLLLAQTQQAQDSITVTATRTETRTSDTPASVVILSSKNIEQSAAATVDDTLRQVAGFTLFRRTGSRVANPTTQGVSLRGIGASGASRALVLDDGIPLNDPFGGWVYWGRVPRAALARAEVLRGGASDLYGSAAMSGVIQFIRRDEPSVHGEASIGSDATAMTSLFAASENLRVAADLFTTDGYVLVAPSQRGVVDTRADSQHAAVDATLAFGSAFVRAAYYRDERHNGTPLQINETTIRQLAGGGDAIFAGGMFTLRAYGSDQDYHQTFSAIDADRNSERLTAEQFIPSRGFGGSLQWSRPIGNRHAIVTGAELHDVRGTVDDRTNDQRITSAFVEDIFVATTATSITTGLRIDNSELSPRISVLHHASDSLAFTASAYRAFRLPTLNELHRDFRVGNVLTQANPDLGPERLTAIEAGARVRNVRINFFSMKLVDAVANVTLSVTPTLITRQRQNIGESRSRGAELESDWRVRNVRISAGYLFVDAVLSGGKRVPQVARNSFTTQFAWNDVLAVQARWSSQQFDDDLNQFPLRGYFAADAFASHRVAKHLDATIAIENIFDRRIEASATPVTTLGQPRAWRVGLRFVP
ncbi:MAG TPA: TonB-dependent receptor [Thermoanaerobaculia bacterium]|nr:TonB-dependent receptor [Thermoanaerobaculia bacterium]